MKTKLTVILLIVACVVVYYMTGGRSKSSFTTSSGSNLMVQEGSIASKAPASIFDLGYNLKCVPGPGSDSYYTRGLTPGGVCGDQAYVQSQIRDFQITGGIGGSLMDK